MCKHVCTGMCAQACTRADMCVQACRCVGMRVEAWCAAGSLHAARTCGGSRRAATCVSLSLKQEPPPGSALSPEEQCAPLGP